MVKIQFIIFVIILFGIQNIQGQNIDFSTSFNNDDIKFELIRYSLELVSDSVIRLSRYNIVVNGYEEQKEYLKQLDKQSIIRLLKDKNSAWMVNLLLYDIYKKKADIFLAFDIRQKKDWEGYFEEQDILYWEKNL